MLWIAVQAPTCSSIYFNKYELRTSYSQRQQCRAHKIEIKNTNKHVICLALITCTSRMIHSHFIVIQCFLRSLVSSARLIALQIHFLPCSINSCTADIISGIVINILHYAAFRTILWDCCDFITLTHIDHIDISVSGD